MLEPGVISSNAKKIKEKLKAPWTLDENEKLEVPSHIRLEKLSTSALNLYTESGGLLSVFGRYLRKKAAQHNIDISTQPTDKPGIPSAIKISGKTDDDTFIRNFKIIQEAYKRRILLQKAALGYKTEMGL